MGGIVWLGTFIRAVPANGDAAIWLTQVAEGDFSSRTIHLGYLMIARLFVSLSSWFIPSLSIRLNFLSLAAACLALWSMNRLEALLTPGRFMGCAALLWILLPPIAALVTTAEVYPVQVAAELWALSAWARGRSGRAGLAFGIALAVSPTSWVALPLFLGFSVPVSARRAWCRFFSSAIMLWVLVLLYSGMDYWIGPRGIFRAPSGLGIADAFVRRLEQAPASLGWLLLLYGAGLGYGFVHRDEGERRLVKALGYHLVLTLLVDRFSDVPAYALASAVAAILAASALRRGVWESAAPSIGRSVGAAVLALLFLQGFLTDQSIRHSRRKEERLAERCRSVRAVLGPETPIFGTFRERRICAWILDGDAFSAGVVEEDALARERIGRVGLVSLDARDFLPGGVFRRLPGNAWVWMREDGDRSRFEGSAR